MRTCTRCVLPDTFPGLTFDERGQCDFCRDAPPPEGLAAHRDALRGRIEEAIAAARRPEGYECVVAFSGGKDSSYTLKLLVERYGLRCLAVTVDNGFVSEQARENCLAVTAALGVDLVTFRPAPDFMLRMYGESARTPGLHPPAAMRRASAICTSCINLINVHMLRVARQHRVTLVAGGYVGGQVPKDAAVLRLDLAVLGRKRAATVKRYRQSFGPLADRYFALGEDDEAEGVITVINPMLTVLAGEERIVEELGPLGWRRTKDTGHNSSNCRLNDLGILVHFRQHGFNPYLAEIAEQVRSGLMDRESGLRRAAMIPEPSAVGEQARQIGLRIDDRG